MKVAIVHKGRSGRTHQTVEFTGTNAMAQGMEYIYNQQPITVVAVRVTRNEND